jgi:hypothetical protein
MSEKAQAGPTPPKGTGLWVYFIVGPMVVCIAGIGGKIGEHLAGGPGYGTGCYLAAVLSAVVAGLIFARLFQGHPLFWALGALGMLLGGHLTWVACGGRATAAPLSGFDLVVVSGATIMGTDLNIV